MDLINKIKAFNITLLLSYFVGFIYTKLFFKKARLIRMPFFIRNEGKFNYGPRLSCGPNTLIEIFGKESVLNIGNNFCSYYNLHIGCCKNIFIGDNVLIASNVYITDHQHGYYLDSEKFLISTPNSEPIKRKVHSRPVFIGNNVWIGEGVKILPGVNIGSGSIIGAGSVVSKDIPKNTICVGIPAKPIKKYDLNKNVWIKI